jgi:hypothetical protein
VGENPIQSILLVTLTRICDDVTFVFGFLLLFSKLFLADTRSLIFLCFYGYHRKLNLHYCLSKDIPTLCKLEEILEYENE